MRYPKLSTVPIAALLFLAGHAATVRAQEAQAANEDDASQQDEEAAQGEQGTPSGDDALVVPIEVEAPELRVQQGRSEYNTEFIETMPTGQGDLADLLRMNPAVDFSRDDGLSAGAATLRPAEISIHGELYYQNLLLIDGADATSDINPASEQVSHSRDLYFVPSLFEIDRGSSPQGYYLDVELLETVEVYDSNVPVEYGGFTGGVVAAEVKSYRGEDRFSWHFGMQRDEWEEFHITEDDITANDYFNAVYTPDYQKTNFGVSLQRGLTDNLGITLGLTRRQSRFGQRYENDADILQMIEYEDVVDNLMGRIDTRVGDNDVGLSFRYSNRTHDGITSTAYTGEFDKDHRGYGFTAILGRTLARGELDLRLSFDRVSDTLDSASSYFSYHEYLEGSGESRYDGAFGDREQQQTRIGLKPKFSLSPMNLGGSEHTITVGGEYRNTRTFYRRPDDIVFEQYYCVRDMGREGCQDTDGSGASSAGDEFLNRRAFYYAGQVTLDYNEVSAYVQDNIDLGGWQVTMGLRADWSGFLENFDVSPRVSVAWSPLKDGSGELTAGASRYYGRSFFRYHLGDAIHGWREQYVNLTRPRGRAGEEVPCSIPDFVNCTHTLYDNRTGAFDLETPYSDEISLGWRQRIGPFEGKLQLISRESRKSVSRRTIDGLRYYNNDGRSSTDSATMELISSTPLGLGPSETRFTVGLGYRDTKSNRYTDDGYDETLETDLIYYKGTLIPPEELPAWDYNIPLSVRLNSVTTIHGWGITWSNFYVIRRGGTVARDSGENHDSPDTGLSYDIYEDVSFKNLFTINSRVQWTRNLTEGSEYYARFEIHNLLDRVIDTQTSRFSTRPRNTQGRRFWVEVGMRFF